MTSRSAAGALCLHRRRRDPVSVVFLTSGARGLEEVPPARAWAIREAEAKEAAAILGVENLDFLRLPDLGLADRIEQAAQRLEIVLAARRPDLIYLPHAEESHP